jgi:hypothetical protein
MDMVEKWLKNEGKWLKNEGKWLKNGGKMEENGGKWSTLHRTLPPQPLPPLKNTQKHPKYTK